VSPVARRQTSDHHVTQVWVGDAGTGTRDAAFSREGELVARLTIDTLRSSAS
jgi:hypothetical protein